jgi:hypothetical protein
MSSTQKRMQNVNHYRPVILLNIAYNIFAILLDKRLSDIVKKKNLEECQMGFRRNRYTIDNIFIIKHFLNILCHNIDLHNICQLYTVFWLCF